MGTAKYLNSRAHIIPANASAVLSTISGMRTLAFNTTVASAGTVATIALPTTGYRFRFHGGWVAPSAADQVTLRAVASAVFNIRVRGGAGGVMATGPQHYRAAERLIAAVSSDTRSDRAPLVSKDEPETIALAQVHATLALAAAIGGLDAAEGPGGGSATGRTPADANGWYPIVDPVGAGEAGSPDPACCGGTGYADYAAVPCPDPKCPVLAAKTSEGAAP